MTRDGADAAGRRADGGTDVSGTTRTPPSDRSGPTGEVDTGLARLRTVTTPRRRDTLLAAAPVALAVGLGLLPLFVLFVESLSPWPTLANYAEVLDPLYVDILAQSLALGLAATAACLALAYPVTYWLAHRCPGRYRLPLLVSLVLPLWLNYVVLNYTWREILARGGVLNLVLLRLGVVSEPLSLLNTPVAVFVGFVYIYLPYVLLTMYVSMERFNERLVEAARTLGASAPRVVVDVVVPQTLAGAVASALVVYARIAGAFATPEILGGPGVQMIARIIADAFYETLDWPFAAAMAFVFLAVVAVGFGFGVLSPEVRRELKRW
ncbi:ABC transporter permease [Salinigranum halophilum]|uniref:ABC transporter permease n=1 Tax=Salinigranum halophilum TaxID=2565931 RepID=UPI00191BEC15|nr:ABC transporter permease [Salinigranum halophilum]